MAKKPIKVTEVVLRDAHQSLLATRMTMDEMRPILPEMDKINYFSVECWGGATFDSCIRFLDEDPWERLRILRKELPYLRYMKYTLAYAVIGLMMFGAVRLTAMLPLSGWLGVAAQVAVGGAVYVLLCLVWWKVSGNRHILGVLKKSAKSGK